MTWADHLIAELAAGRTVQFRPVGNSMAPRILSRQLVTVAPLGTLSLRNDDIVLCRVSGRVYLHRVVGLAHRNGRWRYLIANNRGHINGWTGTIYGVVVRIET